MAVTDGQCAARSARLSAGAEVFDAQDESYRESVLPRAVTRRLAVEAGARQSFWRYIGGSERVVGIDRFGASGKGADVFPHFGFTADNIVLQIR